jgi:hypothetical protein
MKATFIHQELREGLLPPAIELECDDIHTGETSVPPSMRGVHEYPAFDFRG